MSHKHTHHRNTTTITQPQHAQRTQRAYEGKKQQHGTRRRQRQPSRGTSTCAGVCAVMPSARPKGHTHTPQTGGFDSLPRVGVRAAAGWAQ